MIYVALLMLVLGWWGFVATVMGERDEESSRNLVISVFFMLLGSLVFTWCGIQEFNHEVLQQVQEEDIVIETQPLPKTIWPEYLHQ